MFRNEPINNWGVCIYNKFIKNECIINISHGSRDYLERFFENKPMSPMEALFAKHLSKIKNSKDSPKLHIFNYFW